MGWVSESRVKSFYSTLSSKLVLGGGWKLSYSILQLSSHFFLWSMGELGYIACRLFAVCGRGNYMQIQFSYFLMSHLNIKQRKL